MGGIMDSLKEIFTPGDVDQQYIATQIQIYTGDDDTLSMRAAKELAQLSSDLASTGQSAGTLGAYRTNMYNAGVVPHAVSMAQSADQKTARFSAKILANLSEDPVIRHHLQGQDLLATLEELEIEDSKVQ